MINEYIYCAVNSKNRIQWVEGSSSKTRYFRTDKYLKNAVKYHNECYPHDLWRVGRFSLTEVS